jgi:WD40 repeat protein
VNKRFAIVAAILVGIAFALLIPWHGPGDPPVLATPTFQIPYDPGVGVYDLSVSPDDRYVLTVVADTPYSDPGTARLYDVQARKQARQLDKAWCGAWSLDGRTLALGLSDGQHIALFDTDTWKIRETLAFTNPGVAKQSITRLAFDRTGNLYAAIRNATDIVQIEMAWGAKVWWKSGEHYSKEPETLGKCQQQAFDVTVASLGEDTLVAISYRLECPVEVLKIHSENGRRTITPEARLNTVGAAFLRFASDGQRLAIINSDGTKLVARDGNGFNRRVLTDYWPYQYVLVAGREPMTVPGHFLDASADGRLIVGLVTTTYGFAVITADDGKTLLIIQNKGTLALSPTGHFLVDAGADHNLNFFTIP